jgi:SAM-dependent methyltransferase
VINFSQLSQPATFNLKPATLLMSLKEPFYPESRFGGFSRLDGTLAFYLRVNALLDPAEAAVDFGCGRGAYAEDTVPLRRALRRLQGKAARVIGLDVDPAAAANPYIDEFHYLEGPRWPLPDGSAGLIVSDHVLEHLADPAAFFAEAWRVLRPGGCLCLRTSNAWSYVGLASRLVPNRLHGGVLDKVKGGQNQADVFPTLYRCNSVPRLRASLHRQGFQAAVYGFGPEPSYLSFSRAAYALGVLYARIAPGVLQPVIFAFARKMVAS